MYKPLAWTGWQSPLVPEDFFNMIGVWRYRVVFSVLINPQTLKCSVIPNMTHKYDDVEIEKLLGLPAHYTEEYYGDDQTKSITRRFFMILLFVIMCSFSFLLGRLSVPYVPPRSAGNSELGSYCQLYLRTDPSKRLTFKAPAQDLIEYGKKSFDEGYGENRTDGTRIYYAGTPNKQIDAAWDALERGMTSSLSWNHRYNRVLIK